MTDTQTNPETVWTPLVDRIRSGNAEALEELYNVLSGGIRFFLCRHLGPQDLDDRVHDTFLIVAQAIQRGDLRDPERLMGFVRTVVRRQIAARIDDAVQSRKHIAQLDIGLAVADIGDNPERAAIQTELKEVAWRILNRLPRRDREILIRFYLREHPQEVICRDMKLTETQFRLIKSRAKSRFTELTRNRIGGRRRPYAAMAAATNGTGSHLAR